MRDFAAVLVALFLLFVALALATALQRYRRRREDARDAERALGRDIVAEVPSGADLTLFSCDAVRFYYGEHRIDKDLVQAVRVLVNGIPIAAYVSRRYPEAERLAPTSFEDRPEGIARDRWDVALETVRGMVLVECGAIRERVSQELARRIYDAVRDDLERRDRAATTPSPPPPPVR